MLAVASSFGLVGGGPTTAAASGPTVLGAGSTWVQIALDQWRADIAHQGFSINYEGNGSSSGRSLYIQGGVDFAASEIPFQPDELNQLHGENKHWQYMPDVAGGTSLMYNLHSPNGARITSLRMTADVAAKIFTGVITSWTDPEILGLNPGLQIRETRILPVIRSDGSGTSAQFSLYLADQAPSVWNAFANAQGCPAPCSLWPPFQGSINANGSDSVANFVANNALGAGAVGYVEAGYAFGRGFPVASLHNASGNYTQPTSQNVATALTHATLYADLSQNLTQVYRAREANAYPMSSYSYMILPCVSTAVSTCSPTAPANFGADKGFVLGTWIIYIACTGQREAAPLGYSPLPPNLIQADFNAVNRLPGHPQTPPLDYQHCPNPTLYRPGAATAAGPSSQPTGAATAVPTPSAGPVSTGQPTAGATAVPPGGTVVTVQSSAARLQQLDGALTVAANTQPPTRTPLWIGLLIVLVAVFVPMLIATAGWLRPVAAAALVGGTAMATRPPASTRAGLAPRARPVVAWVLVGVVAAVSLLSYAGIGFAYSQARVSAAQSAYNTVLDHQNNLTGAVNALSSQLAGTNINSTSATDLQHGQALIAQLVALSQKAQPVIQSDDNAMAEAQFNLEDNQWLTMLSRSSLDQASARVAHLRKALADARTITSDYVLVGAFYQSFYDVAIDTQGIASNVQTKNFAGAAVLDAKLATDVDKAIAQDKAPGLPSDLDAFLQNVKTFATDEGTYLSAVAGQDSSGAQSAEAALKADNAKIAAYDPKKVGLSVGAYYQTLIDDFNSEMAKARLGRG